jgi:hypothetical protein
VWIKCRLAEFLPAVKNLFCQMPIQFVQ